MGSGNIVEQDKAQEIGYGSSEKVKKGESEGVGDNSWAKRFIEHNLFASLWGTPDEISFDIFIFIELDLALKGLDLFHNVNIIYLFF